MLRSHNCQNLTAHIWNRHLVLSLGVPHMAMASISVVFNSAVILTVACAKDLHKPIFILFCNLAVSDLLSSSSGFWIAMAFVADPQSTLVGSREILSVYAFFTTSILATIYNLVAIGIERYLAVAESLWARRRVTRNQVLGIASAVWAFAAFLGFMPLMGWNCLEGGDVSTFYSPLCIDYLAFVTIPHSAAAFILPFSTYLGILVFLRKHKISMGALGQAHATYRVAEIQVARTSIFIWVMALLSYAPFFAGVVFDSVARQCLSDLSPGVYVFRNLTAMMITLNSLANPIIYTLKMKKLGSRVKSLRSPSNNRVEVQAVGKM